VARLLDGDLGDGGHGGELQELRRLLEGEGGIGEQEHGAEDLLSGLDRHLVNDGLGRLARAAALHAVHDVALDRPDLHDRRLGRRHHGRPEPRDDDGHGRADRLRRQVRDAIEAVAADHGVDHLEVRGPKPVYEL
jgi:hypothetical protein